MLMRTGMNTGDEAPEGLLEWYHLFYDLSKSKISFIIAIYHTAYAPGEETITYPISSS